jgi:hypothetical protein
MTRTNAYNNFEANSRELVAMTKLLMPPNDLQRKLKNVSTKIDRRLERNSLVDAKTRAKTLSDLKSLTSTLGDYVTGRVLLQDWMSAVLMTIVLTYLEDGLVLIATKNPRLLEQAEAVNIERILQAPSIDDLRAEVRTQWADKALRGGPKSWLSLLRRLGAKECTRDCASRLQHLWDTRNLIVHGRGIATAAHVAKYPKVAHGARIHVSTGVLAWWITGVSEFVDATDEFFQNYGVNTVKGTPP